jgi:hypothetical protein
MSICIIHIQEAWIERSMQQHQWMDTYKGRKEDPHKHLHRKKQGYGEPANHPMKIPSPHIAQSH